MQPDDTGIFKLRTQSAERSGLRPDVQDLFHAFGIDVSAINVVKWLKKGVMHRQISIIEPTLHLDGVTDTMGDHFTRTEFIQTSAETGQLRANDQVRADVLARLLEELFHPEVRFTSKISPEKEDNYRYLNIETRIDSSQDRVLPTNIRAKIERIRESEAAHRHPLRKAVVFASLIQSLTLKMLAMEEGENPQPDAKLRVVGDPVHPRIEMYAFSSSSIAKYSGALIEADMSPEVKMDSGETVIQFAVPKHPEQAYTALENALRLRARHASSSPVEAALPPVQVPPAAPPRDLLKWFRRDRKESPRDVLEGLPPNREFPSVDKDSLFRPDPRLRGRDPDQGR